MNKTEFIDVLEKSLLRLPKADRDDILTDYEAHFAIGAEKGQTEEEVAAALGDPAELAATYLENLPEGSKGAPAHIEEETEPEAEVEDTTEECEEDNAPDADIPFYTAPDYSSTSKATVPAGAYNNNTGSKGADGKNGTSPDAGSIVGVVFLSLAALAVVYVLAGVWFGLIGVVIGCLTGAVALPSAAFSLFLDNGLICAGSVLLCISLLALAALGIVAAIAGVKGIIALVKIFIGFCKKILYGGND